MYSSYTIIISSILLAVQVRVILLLLAFHFIVCIFLLERA